MPNPCFRQSFHLDWLTRYVFIQSTEVACFKGLKISMIFGILILRVGPALLFSVWKRVKSLQSNDNDILEGGTRASSSCTTVQLL